MVDINAAITSATQTNSGTSSSLTGSSTVDDNFDTFLSLLTTQLKNQDPTKPLDTNEFTQQLIQYTEVEQLLQSNKKLEALVQLSSANTSVALIGYVGKEITTKGDTTTLANGTASWQLDSPANSGSVTYVVKDADGNEVFSTNGELKSGENTFNWDGTTSTGGTAEPGNYSLTVTAVDAAQDPLTVAVSVKGLVDGVDMTGDVPVLLVNGTRFNINDVKEIHTAG